MILAGQDLTAATLNALPAPLDVLTTGSVTNTTTETTIGTFPNGIPAGDASANSGYEFVVTGTYDSSGTPTLRIRLYVASIATGNRIYDSAAHTTAGTGTNQPWWVRGHLVVIGTGSGGTFDGGGVAGIADGTVNTIMSLFAADAINTTVANPIIVTAAWGTASTSNICRTRGGTLGRL